MSEGIAAILQKRISQIINQAGISLAEMLIAIGLFAIVLIYITHLMVENSHRQFEGIQQGDLVQQLRKTGEMVQDLGTLLRTLNLSSTSVNSCYLSCLRGYPLVGANLCSGVAPGCVTGEYKLQVFHPKANPPLIVAGGTDTSTPPWLRFTENGTPLNPGDPNPPHGYVDMQLYFSPICPGGATTCTRVYGFQVRYNFVPITQYLPANLQAKSSLAHVKPYAGQAIIRCIDLLGPQGCPANPTTNTDFSTGTGTGGTGTGTGTGSGGTGTGSGGTGTGSGTGTGTGSGSGTGTGSDTGTGSGTHTSTSTSSSSSTSTSSASGSSTGAFTDTSTSSGIGTNPP